MDEVNTLIRLIKEKYYIGMPSNESMIKLLSEYFSNAKSIQLVPDKEGLNHMLIGLNCELENLDNVILLSGHMDTVKPDDSWDIEPRVENGKVYGLGATDMKAFFAALIANKDEISNLGVPVVISITFDEETLGNGIKAITEELKKRNITISYSLIGEPTKNNLVTSSRGNSVYVIQTIGKTCHSMNPENGINALYPMAHLITFIEELNGRYNGIVSLNPVLSEGGIMPNQVCGLANMKLSIRTSNSVLKDLILKEIEEKLEELSKEYGVETKAFKVFELKAFGRNDSVINQTLIATLNKAEEEYLATTEAGEIQDMGIGNITIMGPGDLSLAHKENEFCGVTELLEYSKTLPKVLNIAAKIIKDNYKKGLV